MTYDLSTWHVVDDEDLDAQKQDDMIDAIEDGLNGLLTSQAGYVAQSLIDAKGDLLVGSAADTIARLAAGTNGYVLTATSAATYGVAWAAAAAASALTSASNLVSADVTMTSANTFYDGPSAVLTSAGTWLLVGAVTLLPTNGTDVLTAKLWNGTSVASSGSQAEVTLSQARQIALHGIVTVAGSETWKISATSTQNGGAIKAAAPSNGAGNNASHLFAVKIG